MNRVLREQIPIESAKNSETVQKIVEIEDVQNLLKATREGVNRVAGIVKSLRNFARVDSDKHGEINRRTELGLSVSLGIIQKNGGKIDVDSKPGEESTFTVSLPAGC